jgi:hypothetical protein
VSWVGITASAAGAADDVVAAAVAAAFARFFDDGAGGPRRLAGGAFAGKMLVASFAMEKRGILVGSIGRLLEIGAAGGSAIGMSASLSESTMTRRGQDW